MTAREHLAAQLRVWRKAMRQEDAGDALGVDPSQISRWENGKQLPKMSRAFDIATVYGVDPVEVSFAMGAAWEESSDEKDRDLGELPALRREIAGLRQDFLEIARFVRAKSE